MSGDDDDNTSPEQPIEWLPREHHIAEIKDSVRVFFAAIRELARERPESGEEVLQYFEQQLREAREVTAPIKAEPDVWYPAEQWRDAFLDLIRIGFEQLTPFVRAHPEQAEPIKQRLAEMFAAWVEEVS